MTVLFKRLTVFRFLTVPPPAVHGLPKYDGLFAEYRDRRTARENYLGNFPEDYTEKFPSTSDEGRGNLTVTTAVVQKSVILRLFMSSN